MTRELIYKKAETEEERRGAFSLRYRVFCKEMGDLAESACPGGLETDEFDRAASQLVVLDGRKVVGTMRVLPERRSGRGGFGLSLDEYYDLSPLKEKRHGGFAELSRLCFAPEYRGRASLARLWIHAYRCVEEAGCELGLLMGACWTDNPEDARRFYSLIRERGFVSEDLVLRPRPGLENKRPPRRFIAKEPYQPFVTAPALRMYFDVGFRVLGEPVFCERFNEYQVLVGCHKDEVAEPYLSYFKALPKAERRRPLPRKARPAAAA